MKRSSVIVLVAAVLVFSVPTFAQRSHPTPGGPGGGPPAGVAGGASGHGPGVNGSNGAGPASASDMSHASPSTVLSHNTVIADKIKTLTGQEATTACDGFKNLGQCVAAAHVAKNLNISGGFAALKEKMTGGGGVNLGKAIKALAPDVDAKAEEKKANKQASEDMNEASS